MVDGACFVLTVIGSPDGLMMPCYQEQPVRLPVDGAFDLSTQDDKLVPQQRVFRQQFGFASRQINKHPK